jgi:diguanylate cyclase (GGDEF)-like protein
LTWLAAGVLIVAVYLTLPTDKWYGGAVYDALGLMSCIMITIGARRHRPANALLWYCFAAGEAIWVVGDVIYSVYEHVLHVEPFPSPADAFYLAAYPVLVAGLWLLIRRRSAGRDRAGTLDACIVATGLGLPFWLFVMAPIAGDDSASPITRMISLAYPAADLIMLAMVARLMTTAGARTASYRLLVAALVLLLGSDIAFSLITSFSSYDGGPADAGWLLSYVAWGAAALHPSMRSLSEPAPERADQASVRRLVLLGTIGLLAPGLLVEQGLFNPGQVDWLPLSAGGVALCVLIFLRAAGLVARIQQQAARLETLAMRDELTGLANRRLLEQHIRGGLASGDRVQVALVDLDDFKGINDRLGHAVGDGLLVSVGERLEAAVRPGDLVARLGGDEFALFMPGATDDEADRIVESITAALQYPVSAAEHHLLVQASVGVANSVDTTDPFELLRRADIAMYAAKEAGGRRHVRYRSALDERAIEHARLGAQLRRALDGGQFSLVYQPIVTLPNGGLAGVEALVRWRHPQRGLVSPSEFVPVAERNGLVVELGQWVLQQACRQAADWLDEYGPAAPSKISVNVSPRQLAEPGFADRLAEVLADTGLPASWLTIEVTETAVFNGRRSVEALEAVRAVGVQVALDDFGTGHSSLRLLQTCPVDILKVDKSFVDNIAMTGQHAVIAAALINVSDGLNLVAVAEGVETSRQADELFRLGYRFAQGYLFGRPVAADELARAFTPLPAHEVLTVT